MPYIGNPAVVGDSTNTFKLLDDIQSFTLTFDATDTSVVSISADTLTFRNHRFLTGQRVTYNDGGGTAIGGLADGVYFIIKVDQNTIKLASSASNAASSTAINLTSGAAGGSHTLNVAFDSINTKFSATHSSGTKAGVSRAGQISLSINGVIQQPQDTGSPTVGYGVLPGSIIIFSTAPAATDKVFGTFIGEVAASFDLTDNTVDNFTGDGSTTSFNLSRDVPSSNDVLVTLDGVTQYPTDSSTTRSYSVIESTLTFVSAPDTGVAIQVRHIGFAGATTSAVTGFYGRQGNVALVNTDDISVQNISAGIGTFNTIAVGGTVSIGGTLTYEDVTNIDSVGLVTARNGIVVGSGITLSKDGDGFFTGIVTATTFSGALSGSGANITAINASNIGSGTVPTARLGSGTASSSTFLRGDSSFQTVNTDLVSDTSPQLGGNLDVNTKNILFGDSSDGSSDDVLIFGAGSDLAIHHHATDGSKIYSTTVGLEIKDTGGFMRIRSNELKIQSTSNENYIECDANGAVQLFYDNAKTFETVDGGVEVFGVLQMDDGNSHIKLIDGARLDIGSSADLKLYHSGGNSFITNATGQLEIRSDTLILQDSANGHSMLKGVADGAVELYHDNGKRLETTTNGITMTGDQLVIGTNGQVPTLKAGGTNTDIRVAAVGSGGFVELNTNSTARWRVAGTNGEFFPVTDNTYDIGAASYRVRNIYTADLHCSNRGSKNDVDGTWGDYTIQEGESDLFLINNRSGKKYKFNLTEVS